MNSGLILGILSGFSGMISRSISCPSNAVMILIISYIVPFALERSLVFLRLFEALAVTSLSIIDNLSLLLKNINSLA